MTHSQFLNRGSRASSEDKVCGFLRRERAGSNQKTVVYSNVLQSLFGGWCSSGGRWWCGMVPCLKQLGSDDRNLAFRRNCQHQLLQWAARLFYYFLSFLLLAASFPFFSSNTEVAQWHPSPCHSGNKVHLCAPDHVFGPLCSESLSALQW